MKKLIFTLIAVFMLTACGQDPGQPYAHSKHGLCYWPCFEEIDPPHLFDIAPDVQPEQLAEEPKPETGIVDIPQCDLWQPRDIKYPESGKDAGLAYCAKTIHCADGYEVYKDPHDRTLADCKKTCCRAKKDFACSNDPVDITQLDMDDVFEIIGGNCTIDGKSLSCYSSGTVRLKLKPYRTIPPINGRTWWGITFTRYACMLNDYSIPDIGYILFKFPTVGKTLKFLFEYKDYDGTAKEYVRIQYNGADIAGRYNVMKCHNISAISVGFNGYRVDIGDWHMNDEVDFLGPIWLPPPSEIIFSGNLSFELPGPQEENPDDGRFIKIAHAVKECK